MFKISAVQDFEEQKRIAALCGSHAREGFFAYVMRDCDSGDVIGFSQFEISTEGYISDLRSAAGKSDFEAMFILGRSTMNFIDGCGAHICRAPADASDDGSLMRSVGFREENGEYTADMTGMFDGSRCSGEAVKL